MPRSGPAFVPGWGGGSPRLHHQGREARPALRLGHSRCDGTALRASGVRSALASRATPAVTLSTVRVGTFPDSTHTGVSELRVGCPVTSRHCPRCHSEGYSSQENDRQAEAKTTVTDPNSEHGRRRTDPESNLCRREASPAKSACRGVVAPVPQPWASARGVGYLTSGGCSPCPAG